jgi:hypothetical protein
LDIIRNNNERESIIKYLLLIDLKGFNRKELHKKMNNKYLLVMYKSNKKYNK